MARSSEAELRRGEAATWGARSGPTAPRPKMRFVSWKPIAKGSLHGFARVELPIGLKLIDCAVFVGTKGACASPPAKPQLDQDGSQRNGVDGKPSYFPAQKAVFGRPCNEAGRADPPAGRRREVVK
jgi:hypothetical protein